MLMLIGATALQAQPIARNEHRRVENKVKAEANKPSRVSNERTYKMEKKNHYKHGKKQMKHRKHMAKKHRTHKSRVHHK